MAKSNLYIERQKSEFEKNIEFLNKELGSLRTGRAQSTLVENIQVEAYGSAQPLKQLASISIPEAKSISIEAWDKSVLKEIEKALTHSNLGLSIVNTGEKIIAKIPPMTEENRKQLLKLVNEKTEEARIGIRKVRDKVKEEILAGEKNNEITQDDRYQYLADLDNYVSDYNDKIEEIKEKKEKDIMTV
jgi:ribosome recycling factor